MNLSTDSFEIPLCNGKVNVCITSKWFAGIIYFVNVVALILNSFHIFMLKRCGGTKLSTHLKIMIMLTVIEINNAIKNMVEYTCSLRLSLVEASRVPSAILLLYTDSLQMYKFAILTVAFIDRWWALARPFSYAGGLFTKYLWCWISSQCVVISCLILMRDLISNDAICMDLLYGITNFSDETNALLFTAFCSLSLH